MKKLLLIAALILLGGFGAWQFFGQGGLTHEAQCKAYGNTWWAADEDLCDMGLIQADEKKQWCRRAGGRYNECYMPKCAEGFSCIAACSTSCSF